MKAIIRISIVLLVIYLVRDYMKEHNLTLIEMFSFLPEEETKETKQHQIKSDIEVVTIKALGDVDYSDLTDAKKIIEEVYYLKCIISEGEPITNDLYINGTDKILDAEACFRKFQNIEKVIYIVDKKLWTNGDYLRGYATVGGNFVIVRGEKHFLRETLIHELGHSFGLRHCENLKCVMAVQNDRYDTGDFCRNCKKQIQTYLNK